MANGSDQQTTPQSLRGGRRAQIARQFQAVRQKEFQQITAQQIAQRQKELAQFEAEQKRIEEVNIRIEASRQEQLRAIAKTEQAIRLIQEGKELAARDDPSLRKEIQRLKALGFVSIANIKAQQEQLKAALIQQGEQRVPTPIPISQIAGVDPTKHFTEEMPFVPFPTQRVIQPVQEPSKFKKFISFFDTSGLAEARARIAVRGEGKLQEGTQLFEEAVQERTQSVISGQQLQSAVFLSFAGVRTIPKPQTTFLATAERTPSGTVVKVIGETTGERKPVSFIGQEVVQPIGKKIISGAKGITFRAEDIFVLPSTKPITRLTDIKPFISVSVGEKVGKAKVVKQLQDVRVTEELAGGTIVRSRTITKAGEQRDVLGLISKVSPKQPDVTFQFGGQPTLKVSKEGVKLKIQEVDVRGFVFRIPSKAKPDTGVQFQAPADIKKTPLTLTFQEQQAVTRIVSSARKASQESLKRSGGLLINGKPSLLPRMGVGVSGILAIKPSDTLSDFLRGFGQSILSQEAKQRAKAEEEQVAAERTKEIQKQIPKTKQVPRLQDVSLLAQPQLQTEAQRQFLRQLGLLKVLPKLKQVPKQIVPSITKPIPTPKVPVIPNVSEVTKAKIRKALGKLKGKSVDIQVGGATKGRPIRILKKNIAPKRAWNLAQRFIDKNIEASYKLIPNPKAPKKKDIRNIKTSGKFRRSKRSILFQVEKRRFRLDSPTEKRQIKQSKRRKKKK